LLKKTTSSEVEKLQASQQARNGSSYFSEAKSSDRNLKWEFCRSYFSVRAFFERKILFRMLAAAKVYYLSPEMQPEAAFLNFNGA
jgi:hypothetical protein